MQVLSVWGQGMMGY